MTASAPDPVAPEKIDSILRPQRSSFLFTLAAFVVVVAGLKAAQDLVLIVLAAVFVAVAVAPAVYFLYGKGAPFAVSLALVVTAVLGVFAFMAGIVGSSVSDFRRQLPVYEARARESFNEVSDYLGDYGVSLEIERLAGDLVNPNQVLDLAANLFSGLGSILANGFLIVIMVIFLLLEMEGFPDKLRAAFGGDGTSILRFRTLGSSINQYLLIKTWVSLLTGLIAGLLCAIVGVDFPLLWGLLAFLFNYVPNIGSIVAAVPPVLLAAVQLGPGRAGIILVGYVLINNVIGNIVEPKFMGEGLGLSTFAVIVSLIFWGWILGPVGMLLSIPLTMAVKIAMDASDQTRWIAVLLGSSSDVDQVLAQRAAAAHGPPAGGEQAVR